MEGGNHEVSCLSRSKRPKTVSMDENMDTSPTGPDFYSSPSSPASSRANWHDRDGGESRDPSARAPEWEKLFPACISAGNELFRGHALGLSRRICSPLAVCLSAVAVVSSPSRGSYPRQMIHQRGFQPQPSVAGANFRPPRGGTRPRRSAGRELRRREGNSEGGRYSVRAE